MSISENNNHIEDYLDYYCQLSQSPKFAILLKGKWGSGKTWFIKRYRDKLKDKGKKTLYVSLYGVRSYSDIEELLFQQTHPILSSDGMVIASKVLKVFAKLALKVDFDLNKDTKPDASLNIPIPDIEISKKFKDSNYNLLIFDDLERCSMDLSKVLGYINIFVESQDLKVLIVANESEIDCKWEGYKRVKEKVIGKTFEIFPDFQGAINSFTNEIQNQAVKEIILSKIDYISILFHKGEFNNLRVLHRIILDFERLFKELPSQVSQKADVIQNVLQILTIFSIEISKGKLKVQKIHSIQDVLNKALIASVSSQRMNNRKINEDSKEEDEDIDILFEKYGIRSSFYTSNEWFPNLLWWEIFFDKGIIDTQLLLQIIPTSQYFQDKNTPNWLKLLHYSKISNDHDFKEILNLVESEYLARSFEDIGIVKHITGLFLMFSKAKLYPKTKQSILTEAKKYIDDLKNSKKLDVKYHDEMTNVYMSTQYAHSESQEFQEFNRYIKQSQEKARIQDMPEKANQLMDIMLNDIATFRAMICINASINEVDEKYYDFPVFNYLSEKEFINNILLLSNEDKGYIFSCLEQRYKENHAIENLLGELTFLKKVKRLLLKEIRNRSGELSGHILNRLNESYLVKAIDNLEKIKQTIQSNNT